MTDSERVLWSRLRRKQLHGVQFYRQMPIGSYIVDFYAPKCKLVVEVDGSQHFEDNQAERDWERDDYLRSLGIEVLRFTNLEVLRETDAVADTIYEAVAGRLEKKSPLPPFNKGG